MSHLFHWWQHKNLHCKLHFVEKRSSKGYAVVEILWTQSHSSAIRSILSATVCLDYPGNQQKRTKQCLNTFSLKTGNFILLTCDWFILANVNELIVYIKINFNNSISVLFVWIFLDIFCIPSLLNIFYLLHNGSKYHEGKRNSMLIFLTCFLLFFKHSIPPVITIHRQESFQFLDDISSRSCCIVHQSLFYHEY